MREGREREGKGKGASEEGRIREGVREGKGWEQGKRELGKGES